MLIGQSKIKNLQDDWVALEVRDKGAHALFSTWIGELQLRVKDFKDGKGKEKQFVNSQI